MNSPFGSGAAARLPAGALGALSPLAPLGLFLLYALASWLLFAPMLMALHGHWTTANDLDAGYLLLAVALWVLWQRSQADSAQLTVSVDKKRYTTLAALVFIVCLAGAGLAALTANKSVTLALLVVAYVPLASAVTGWINLSSAAHASAILLMATPIWFVLVPPLQTLTAKAVNWLLARGDWPIYIENNLIALPQGLLEIAAGCAGLKFFQTALALTLIEGFIAKRSWRAMMVIGLVAGVLAIVSNWLRVALITLLALYLGPEHSLVADHNWVGWLLFALLFGPLFWYLGGVSLLTSAAPHSPTDSDVNATTNTDFGVRNRATKALAATLCLALGFGSVWLLNRLAVGERSVIIGQQQLAAIASECHPAGLPHPLPAGFVGAQLALDCALGDGRYFSLRGYVSERQEQEVINPVNTLMPGTGLLDYPVTSARTGNDSPALYRAGDYLVAYGFYASGKWTGAPGVFKAQSLLRPLIPGPVWALVVTGELHSPDSAALEPASIQRDQNLTRRAFEGLAERISNAATDQVPALP